MTNAVDAIKVDVTVKLIGIIGCSASGKSTVAHQLVSRLDSPLHPISTDNFFSDEVCAQLGTYEDYRCINYDAVAQWMSVLVRAVPTVSVSVLEGGCALSSSSASGASSADANAAMRLPRDWEDRVHEAWWEEIVLHLPEVGKYRRAAPYATSAAKASTSVGTAAAAPAGQCGSTLAEATFTGAHPHDGLSDKDEDLSLCAHEAEEEDRRRISVSALTQRTDGGSGTVSLPLNSRHGNEEQAPHTFASLSHHLIIYVVWEGFTLLCNRLVNSYIDYAIDVHCDLETACLRRFFRTPRRHLARYLTYSCEEGCHKEQDESQLRLQRTRAAVVAGVVRQVYRSRIEQLWRVRSQERQRIDLMNALEQELRLEGSEVLVDVHSPTAAPSPTGIAACDALDLLAPPCFDPPRPRCLREHPHSAASTAMGDGGGDTCEHSEGCDAEAVPSAISSPSASPVPGVEEAGRRCSVCWTADGLPTNAFQIFWETEFDEWLTRPSSPLCTTAVGPGAAALVWASLRSGDGEGVAAHAAHRVDEGQSEVKVSFSSTFASQPTPSNEESALTYVNRMLAQYGALALLQSLSRDERGVAPSSPELPRAGAKGASAAGLGLEQPLTMNGAHRTVGLPAETLSSALAPFYYEFRYWYAFEVLYFDRIFHPLQAHRLRWRSVVGDSRAALTDVEGRRRATGACGDTNPSSAVPRPWWVVRNGRDVHGQDAGELWAQVDCISAAIRAIC